MRVILVIGLLVSLIITILVCSCVKVASRVDKEKENKMKLYN